jgi:hypothetical protein
LGSHTLRKKLGARRYRKVSSGLTTALRTGKFEQAAKYGASISALVSAKDAFAILVSATHAYKEGKESNWTASSADIARTGIKRAAQLYKAKLAPSKQQVVQNALSEAAERAKSRHKAES